MFFPKVFTPAVIAVAVSVAFLTGCGGDSSASNTGKVSMQITDAPVDGAVAVYVQFSGVVFVAENEDKKEVIFDEPKRINLLDFQNGEVYSFLNEVELPAGRYNQIRLLVDTDENNDTIIELADGTYELTIPSGDQTGLKLVSGFTVNTDETVSFTLDFDLRKSITVTGNGEYKLRPTIRIVDTTEAAFISGTIASGLCAADDQLAVYVYEGDVSQPEDLGAEAEPLATASVATDLTYTASFLAPGEYTLALTCDADLDDPEVDDEEFGAGTGFVFVSEPITVVAEQTATLNMNPS
jgi:hypothetical protein